MLIKKTLRAALFAASCISLGSLASADQPIAGATVPSTVNGNAAVAAHPLDPAIEMAYKQLKYIKENVKDYTCTLVKRERVQGKLQDVEYIYTKVRHEPFSIYMQFLKPDKVEGREVIYVHGANNNELLAHEGKGLIVKNIVVSLKPTSQTAMNGNRYPITEVGVKNLSKRLIEVAESDRNYGECEIANQTSVINKRECDVIQVTHPVPRKNFIFHVARVYVDKGYGLPVRYEAYDWPAAPGGEKVLTEEYTYINMKLNVGLTDADFDAKNPQYKFGKKDK